MCQVLWWLKGLSQQELSVNTVAGDVGWGSMSCIIYFVPVQLR